jgi:hypothetical protein
VQQAHCSFQISVYPASTEQTELIQLDAYVGADPSVLEAVRPVERTWMGAG